MVHLSGLSARKAWAVAVTLLLPAASLVGCSQDTTEVDGPLAPLAAKKGPPTVRFGTTCPTSLQLTLTASGYDASMAGTCNQGGDALGKGAEISADFTVDLSSGDPTDQPLTMQLVIMTGRGDELHASSLCPNRNSGSTIEANGDIHFIGIATVTYATGRLAGAIGKDVAFSGSGNRDAATGSISTTTSTGGYDCD